MDKTGRLPAERKRRNNTPMRFTAVLCVLVLLFGGMSVYLLVRVSRLEKQVNGETPAQGITDYIDEKNKELKNEIEQEQQDFAGEVSKIINRLADAVGVTLTDD